MSGHTPGPWAKRAVPNVGLKGHTGYAIDFNEDQEQVVDFVYEEADADLIAAAPDLLASLEEILRKYEAQADFAELDTDGKAASAARAAIAKAKGLTQ